MTLRNVTQEDLSIFFEHERDPDAHGMAALPARTWDAFVEHWRVKVLGEGSVRKKTIVVDGHVGGYVVSWEQKGERLIGYWVGRAFWSRGVATAALLEFVAGEATRRVHAHVATGNAGSVRVLEKCGVRRVGDCTIGPDGVAEYVFRLESRIMERATGIEPV